MTNRDTASLALADLAAAFSLLTRLPVPTHAAPSPRAAWWPSSAAAATATAASAPR